MLDSKTGVLIVNLGTPDGPDRRSVYRYLKQFLLDARVIDYPWLARNLLVRGIIAPFRSGSSAKLYQRLWTPEGSPLKTYGYSVMELLQAELGSDYVVELGMRYQTPSIEAGLESLRKANVKKIVVIPMFPQYASASSGSVHEEVMRVISKWLSIPEFKFVSSFGTHPKLIEAFKQNALTYDISKYQHILFSFHGIPQRHLTKADCNNHCLKNENCCSTLSSVNQLCYSAQCYATAQSIAASMGLNEDMWSLSFQSRLGYEPWTQPYTSVVLEELAEKGIKNVLVFSPAFVADCLETTVEIAYEYREEFEEKGGEHLDLVPSLNNHPLWIETLKDLVVN
jgi:protoporphyrin/coproporphyrin ferrochelatase